MQSQSKFGFVRHSFSKAMVTLLLFPRLSSLPWAFLLKTYSKENWGLGRIPHVISGVCLIYVFIMEDMIEHYVGYNRA